MSQAQIPQQVLDHLRHVYVPGRKRVPSLRPGTWDLEIGRRGSVTYVAIGPLPYKKSTRRLLGLAEDLLALDDEMAEWADCPNCTRYHRKGAPCYPARR